MWAVAGLALLGFSVLRVVQFEARRAATAGFAAMLRAEPRIIDLSAQGWQQAFDDLIRALAAEYPFTEWKGIDWPALRAEFAPRIARAERANDRAAYYRALRELAWRIPDGHVDLVGNDDGLREAAVGGGFGLGLARLDDGRVVVSHVAAAGPAARAGVHPGDEVQSWNGRPILDALAETPVIWSEAPPATAEGRLLLQRRFLVRAPVGTRATLRARSRGSEAVVEYGLAAAPEPEAPPALDPARELLFGCGVDWKVLPGGIGYIRIEHELPSLRCVAPEAVVRSALVELGRRGATGVVLDVRGNFGGEDATVPRLVSFFVPAPRVYERVGMLDRTGGGFAPRGEPLRVVPAEPRFAGRMAVLVDEETFSSGEGIPMVLRGLPGVAVVGLHGTHGSFAINQKEVRLPADLSLRFPQARSLDDQGRIQVDGDARGIGGIVPDVRVPMDEGTLEALNAGRDVVLERALRLLADGRVCSR
jgi:carboxyl-terminal processing protease